MEAIKHQVIVRTLNEEVQGKKSFSEVLETLEGDGFIQCHRSFVANINHIKKLDKKDLYMDCGQTIPISRRRYQETHQAFINYYKNYGG